ncbi:hypothetical protein GCM10027425_18730 [Alteromonas gracilis]
MRAPSQSFGVALACIDGRLAAVPRPTLCAAWGVDYVDLVTVPGPEVAVTELPEDHVVWEALRISMRAHGSVNVAVVAHTDCAANGVDAETRVDQVRATLGVVRERLGDVDVSGWVIDTATGAMDQVA